MQTYNGGNGHFEKAQERVQNKSQPTVSTIKLQGRPFIHGIDPMNMALLNIDTVTELMLQIHTLGTRTQCRKPQDAMTLTVSLQSLHAAQLDTCADALTSDKVH